MNKKTTLQKQLCWQTRLKTNQTNRVDRGKQYFKFDRNTAKPTYERIPFGLRHVDCDETCIWKQQFIESEKLIHTYSKNDVLSSCSSQY